MARRLSAAIVLGAGAGTRFGAAKQFADLDGTTLLDHALRTAASVAERVVAVVPADAATSADTTTPADTAEPAHAVPGTAPRGDIGGAVRQVTGGASRRESVAAGLAALADLRDDATVLVHDAAHPLASTALAGRVADRLLAGAQAVVPALAATDTVKTVAGGRVTSTVPRGAVLVQMPHAYVLGVLRAAHRLDVDAQDDSGLVEALGVPVEVVDGEITNVHVTTSGELVVASALAHLAARRRARHRPGDTPDDVPDDG